MGKKKSKKNKDQVVYSEFGNTVATERPEQPDVPPNQQKITIQASRKGRKGKTVTVVSGFQLTSQSLQDLSKKLKNLCGSGGTIKDDNIEIQGDHRPKIQTFLTDLGYKTKISGG